MGFVAPTVSYAEVKSTLGTSFWIRSDSASDYVLDPAFLRFLIIAIGLYALLDQGGSSPKLVGWQLPILWLSLAGAVLVGYVLTLSLLLGLTQRGTIRRHYTPFIFVPILIIAEATSQGIFWLLDGANPQPPQLMLADVARNALVLFLFDLLHVHYVVPAHPLAMLTRPDIGDSPVAAGITAPPPAAQPAAAPGPSLPPDEAAPIVVPDRPMVLIADRSFALTDLLSVRTEDHYLNVVTRSGRSMLRAKLSDITALHDGRHGVQINRSQWVSFAAVETVIEEDNGQVTLHLIGGETATVSRTRRLMFMQFYNALRGRQT